MKNDYNMSLEIIKNVNEYLEKEDYAQLKEYIDKKKEEVELCRKQSKDKSSEYMNKLIKNLH